MSHYPETVLLPVELPRELPNGWFLLTSMWDFEAYQSHLEGHTFYGYPRQFPCLVRSHVELGCESVDNEWFHTFLTTADIQALGQALAAEEDVCAE